MEDPRKGSGTGVSSAILPHLGRGSLGRQVMTWFVLMAVIPLLSIALVSYSQSKDTLTLQALERLNDASSEAHGYITNWLDYRRLDIASQAEAYRNAWLLEYLIEGQKASGLAVKEYVNSPDWEYKLSLTQGHLLALIRRYEYVKDIFLIDTKGDLFYSSRPQRTDLGANLFQPPLASTQFAYAVRQALEHDDYYYSDVERYQPDGNKLSSFIAGPLLNERGEKIGAFAVQIQLDSIINMLDRKSNSGYQHYLVGSDGLLRSSLSRRGIDVLTVTPRTPFVNKDAALESEFISAGDQSAWKYQSADGRSVFGISRAIHYLGVDWTLVSEIDANRALSVSNWLGISIGLSALLIALIAIGLAYLLTRRLTDPIKDLASNAEVIAAGKYQTFPIQKTFSEITALAQAFNHMLRERGQHEIALEESHEKIKVSLHDMALQEQRYRSLVSNIPGIVYRCELDEQWTMLFMSDFVEKLTGYAATDFIGNHVRTYDSIIHSDDRQLVSDAVSDGIKRSGSFLIEYRIVDRAGRIRWVFERGALVVRAGDGDDFLDGFIMDITPIKETELALLEAKKIAEAASTAKSDFLAVVSHEIRTPLNGVIGMLGILENMQLTPEQHQKACVAKDSANSLLALINDILDFSKVEAGKLELEETVFDVVKLMESTVDAIAFKAQEKGIELQLNTQDIKHSWVCGDPTRIRQVITNLVSNAVKFTLRGHVKVSGQLEQTARGDQFVCCVSDTGIGIDQAALASLFDSFTQADASTTRKYGGTGLGLAICKRLCEFMGGDIHVTSVLGQGSEFTFNIPLATTEAPALAEASDAMDVSDGLADVEKIRLLLVDDNQINLLVAEELLSSLGIVAVTACNGLEAIDTLRQAPEADPFTVILMDCQMPEMDGYEATVCIRRGDAGQRYTTIPVIAVTANAMSGDREKCVAAGMDDYLSKPIMFDQLVATLTRWCNDENLIV